MLKILVRLEGGTTGKLPVCDMAEAISLIGDYVVIDLFGHNGMPIQVEGILAEILE